jgi:hypothetical protein
MPSVTQRLTVADVLAWPPTVDVETAGAAFGVGRTKAYELARTETFPVPILRLGTRMRVRRADVLHALGIEDRPGATA